MDSSRQWAALLRVTADRGRVATENWRVRKDGSRFWACAARLQLDIHRARVDDRHPGRRGHAPRPEALGVRFAIDDFGTGYTSLSRLRQLPSTCSRAGALRRRPRTVPADSAVVDAIVGLARSFGLTVLAEGVETRDQESILEALGCEYAQGSYYAEPAPAATIDALLGSSPPTVALPGVS